MPPAAVGTKSDDNSPSPLYIAMNISEPLVGTHLWEIGVERMKKIAVILALVFLVFPSAAAAAGSAECMSTFYKTNDFACVEGLLDSLRTVSAEQARKGSTSFQAAVGFLSEIFGEYPQEKKRILTRDTSALAKSVFMEALCRAGLQGEAREYAQANGFSAEFKRFQEGGPVSAKLLKPNSRPADNDLLIGAYMATGDTQLIKNILANYSSATDTMASDAFRFGFLQGRADPKDTRKGQAAMVRAGCQKYACKADMQTFMRVMTLSSAFWALQSLGQSDVGIKKTFTDFFNSDPRLNRLLKIEHSAFSNYMTMLIAHPATKSDPSIEAFLSSYEQLEPPQKAKDALLRSPLFEKRKN